MQNTLDVKASADKLIELRGKRTQSEVASAIGISVSALAMYEKGERVPRDPIKIALANFYGQSIGDIFFILKTHET
jgi:DNA-binding XRE family transcriptional regulator